MSFHSQRGRINLCSSDDIPIGSTTGEILTASAPASPIKALYPSKASVQVKAPFKSNNKNIEKIKFESLIQDFAGFTSARGYSSWKTNLIDQGYYLLPYANSRHRIPFDIQVKSINLSYSICSAPIISACIL